MNQTQTESMRFALEALEGLINRTSAQAIYSFMETERRIAISACVGLRETLAEQPQQEIDWKDQYEKQKRRADMWVAKYEADIGPLEQAGPVAAQQEPVAWLEILRNNKTSSDEVIGAFLRGHAEHLTGEAFVITSPPASKPLKSLMSIARTHPDSRVVTVSFETADEAIAFEQYAIEAAHGIKEQP